MGRDLATIETSPLAMTSTFPSVAGLAELYVASDISNDDLNGRARS